MQIYFKENLAMLAVPKTGSTAYEMALRGRADIIFAKRRKHMTLAKYHKHIVPFLDTAYDLNPVTLAVMRDPVDHLRSWYRYRSRPVLIGSPKSTAGMSFDAYVRDVVSDAPPPYASVGLQSNMLTLSDGSMPLHHLFCYENQPQLRSFLESRFETDIKLNQKNVSPQIDAPLNPESEAELRLSSAEDVDLYARLCDAGGHSQQKTT